jgi:dTDP-4-dehydrorhamnose reductase
LRILLTGRDGQVGWELERTLQPLGEVVATGRAALDLANPSSLKDFIGEVKPALIVNAAAYTAVDKAESEPELARHVNGEAPGIMAEEAKRLGALLVHYSTDYVFDGEKRSPYLEDDAPHPLGAYGRTKLEGERRVAASGCRALLLRASWVYSPSRGRNFFRTIAGKALAGERLRVVDDQVGVPTPSDFLASLSLRLIRDGATGVYHAVPSGETSWHGFASLIVEKVGARVAVEPIASSEFPTAAVRPRYSVLSNARLAARLGAPLPDWRQVVPPIMKAS